MSERSPQKWPEGLAETIDTMKPLVLAAFEGAQEAKRRVWAARDEVDRLKRSLVEAEVALIAAERDYTDCGELMQSMWRTMREQVERIPVDAVSPSSGTRET